MRILVISRTAWNKNNSFGNTYSNFFHSFEDFEIANIFLADGSPDGEERVVSYYQVSEKKMCKSLFKARTKENQVGSNQVTFDNSNSVSTKDSQEKLREFSKKKRWPILYIARELAWKFGQANKDGIIEFVRRFNPDVIFLPLYYASYVSDMALYIKKHFDIPIILEASLDVYSLRQISFDPFFWINRFMIRSTIRKVVDKSDFLYVISDKQKRDYQRFFDIRTEVLHKFIDEGRFAGRYTAHHGDLNLLYTGNIGDGRWKTLAMIVDAIKEYGGKVKMKIYTATPVTKKMEEALSVENISQICPPVDASAVRKLQQSADILVHAEPFSLKERLPARYSISTKIVDYISSGRCVFAVCSKDMASYDYLQDISITACDKKEIQLAVKKMVEDRKFIEETAEKANQFVWEITHNKDLRKEFHDSICDVAGGRL